MNRATICTVRRYGSLSAAMADINSSTNTNAVTEACAASVKVCTTPSGRYGVILLDNISESVQIDVNKNIDLALNGKTLTLTAVDACLNFGAGTSSTIDGTVAGSKIVSSENGARYLVVGNGEKLTVQGGTYEADNSYNGNNCAFVVKDGKAELTNCAITVNNSSSGANAWARAVQVNPGAEALVVGCTATATAQQKASTLLMAGKVDIQNTTVTGQGTNGECKALELTGGAKVSVEGSTVTTSCQNAVTYAIINYPQSQLILANSSVSAQSNSTAKDDYSMAIYNAEGAKSTVKDSSLSAVSNVAAAYVIYNLSEFAIVNSTITGESEAAFVYGIEATKASNMDIRHCIIDTNSNSTDCGSLGIANSGTMSVSNSKVAADASVTGAIGVTNHGICYLLDTDVAGIHSGCQNIGHLYVQGGTFTGWTHGGFYFCNGDRPETEEGETGAGYLNYVCDAFTRSGYLGRHAQVFKEMRTPFPGCAYIGSGSEITVFMDNCVIGGEVAVDFDLEEYQANYSEDLTNPIQIRPHAVALRHLLGEINNKLYISNSHILTGTGKIRIDNATDGSDLGHRLYVGLGTNITEDTVNNKADTIFVDGGSYRRSKAFFKAQVE